MNRILKLVNFLTETGDKAFSSIDFVGQCLVDTERTKAFQKAIKKAIKKTSIVLELGSGSGILSLFAARAGAKKVIAVEFDPYVASIAKNNIALNKFSNKIILALEDARKVKFNNHTKFDVVISEMLTTGIVDEHQVQAINNLHDQKLVDENTTYIPERHDTFVSLVNANLNLFGQKISMVLHLWKWHNWKDLKIRNMSTTVLLNSIDFRQKNEEKCSKILEIKITKTGTVNGIYLTSKSIFDGLNLIEDTEALNAPMFIPLSDRKVKSGMTVKIHIAYIFGGGYGHFQAKFV